MINKAILTGRLTSNIELRKTNDGISFAYFTLAVNRSGNSDQTDFISCIAWRGTAELMERYMQKGSLIGVEGRVETYRREKNGQYETITNINSSQVHFLESKTQSANRNNNQSSNSNMTFDKETSFNSSTVNTTNNNSSNSDEKNETKDIDFSSIEF